MEDFIWIVIIFILAPILQRVLKARQSGTPVPAPEDEHGELPELSRSRAEPREREGEPRTYDDTPAFDEELERLIAEELGLKPRSKTRDVAPPSRPGTRPPTPRRPAMRTPAPTRTPPTRTPSRVPSGRVVYPSPAPPAPRLEIRPAPAARLPAATQRHELPKAVGARKRELAPALRRARGIRHARREGPFPDSPTWSPAQKAIVWSEVLGPPRGLVF